MNAQMKPIERAIPEGWIMNGLGHLVPVESVAPAILDEDAFVRELFAKAEAVEKALAEFRAAAFGDVEAFRSLAMEKYGLDRVSPTGYADLRSFDGRLSVQLSVGKKIVFGSDLDAVKALFDSCLNRWTDGMNKHAKALVEMAFRKDRKGEINADKLWELTSLSVEGEADAEWDEAVRALKAAARWVATRPYLRFYRQEKSQKPEMVRLDFSAQ